MSQPPAAPPSGPERVTIAEYRRRHAAGQVSLAAWDKVAIAQSECAALTGDPHALAYSDAVHAFWCALSGRDGYEAVRDETFPIDAATFLPRPFPYSSDSPAAVAHYLGAVAATVGEMGLPVGASVIEYGSGWGHMALTLAATGYRVTAVDINADSVALLRQRAAAMQVPLEVVQSGFLDYEPAAPVDGIVFFEAFHHCAQPFVLLDRCVAQLRDGGRMLFVADALYDDFYAPWGVRLDGAAAFVTAQYGWLELGFRRDFFTAELERRGCDVTWKTWPWLGAYGTVLTATKRTR